jgi:hypothetical protein
VPDAPQTGSEPRLDIGRTFVAGMAITAAGAALGLIVGALADGAAGVWAFVGMGAGAAIAVAVLSVRVVRSL